MQKNEVLLGQARHLLTAIGGGFVTSGYLTANELGEAVSFILNGEIVSGALLLLAGAAWSFLDKKYNIKRS